MTLPDRHHPIWKVIGNLSMLAVILGATASDFDASEMRTLLMFLVGNGALERLTK